MKEKFISILLFLLTILIMLSIAEFAIRIKNMSMKNYDMEMWKYSKELKVASDNPILGHEHLANKCAVLQSVEICLNSIGLRGNELASDKKDKKILFLGSSITLGWGIENSKTLTSLIQKKYNEEEMNVEIINGGIGNYNTVRYVERYLTRLKEINPTDIVVHYFINDSEELPVGGGNFLLRNSQLAVTGSIAYQRVFKSFQKGGLTEHYANAYSDDNSGYKAMKNSLKKLAKYAKEKGINLYLAMTPDIHFLQDYPFRDIHKKMEGVSKELGYQYIDLLPNMEGLDFEKLQIIPGDAHPNNLGHKLMAETIYEKIR